MVRNIRISNFRIGITFTWQTYGSLKTLGSNKVYGNTITSNTYGVGFSDSSQGNEVSGNNITGNSYGMSISGSSNNVFRNNRFDNNQYAIVDDSSGPNEIDTTNTIDGKPIYYWVNQHDKTVPSDAGWVVLKNCSKITVESLNLKGCWHGVLLYYTNGSTISRNIATKNWEGIMLKCSSNNVVLDNQVTANNESGIVLLYNSNNNLISGNRVESNGYGIGVGDDSSNNVVSKNAVAANVRDGVSVGGYNSIGNTVSENQVRENGGNGIFFHAMNDSKVTRNNVTLNKGCGLGLGSGPNGVVRLNYISKNRVGIWMSNAEANTITFNDVTENTAWGIELEGSHKDNVIHHNNFINNAAGQGLQAHIADVWTYPGLNKPHRPGETVEPPRLVGGAANSWDDGSEGNYWSDYSIRYPNATIKSSIGDTPYFINENNQDRYPLMNRVAVSEAPTTTGATPEPASPPPDNATLPEGTQNSKGTAEAKLPLEYVIAVTAAVAFVGIVAASAFLFLKRRKPNTTI
jgi:parallel beta-helix repeat protein